MEEEKKKLTDTQLRIVQAVAGVLCAAAFMVTIALSSTTQGILSYAFLGVFVIVMFGRRWVENKYRLRLSFFNLILIDGLMTGIMIFLITIFVNPTVKSGLTDTAKLLIIIGICLVIIGLGIVYPYMRYTKRKKAGKVVPIRIPEKTEEEAEKKAGAAAAGQSSLYRQMAEMAKELEGKEGENKPAQIEDGGQPEEKASEAESEKDGGN